MKRFNLQISEREASNGIYAAMKAVIESRGQKINLDEPTRQHIARVAQWLINPEGKIGLALRGKYGNGKTTLLKAIKWLVEFTTEFTNGVNEKQVVKMISAKELAELCQTEELRKEYRKYLNISFLAIDDVGEEPAEVMSYGMIYNPMIDLLLHRYDKQLMTIISTNLTKEEFEKKYGGRISDRLREMMEVIKFENKSYRK